MSSMRPGITKEQKIQTQTQHQNTYMLSYSFLSKFVAGFGFPFALMLGHIDDIRSMLVRTFYLKAH